MPLQIKYRPRSFKTFVGSESTTKALQSKLKSDDPPHSYLLTGPSGCGKTTLARIISKYLRAGKHNFIELDSASDRSINGIREIRKQMMLAPIGKGKARVWLLDECHQLTRDAQEALLKALEDPPSHVYFILATTDPQKLRDTLKRRCSHFAVETIGEEDLTDYLLGVVKKEEKEVIESAIDLIVDQCDGSIGKAMALLDTVIDLPLEEQEEAAESKIAEQKVAIDLCRALIKNSSWKSIAGILRGLKETKENPEGIRRAVLGYASSVILKQKNDQAYLILDCFKQPFYDSPFEQLVIACYEVVEGEG